MKKDKSFIKKSQKNSDDETKERTKIRRYFTPSDKKKEIVDMLERPLLKPFKRYADHLNPLLIGTAPSDNAQVFTDLIEKLFTFGLYCGDPRVWKYIDKKTAEKNKKIIQTKRDEIIKLLRELMPKEAKKQIAHQFIRICEAHTPLLISLVNEILTNLYQVHDTVKVDREYRFKDKNWKREKALEIYIHECLEPLYDSLSKVNQQLKLKTLWDKESFIKIISDKRSKIEDEDLIAFPYVALRIISLFYKCSYKGLSDIYSSDRSAHSKIFL